MEKLLKNKKLNIGNIYPYCLLTVVLAGLIAIVLFGCGKAWTCDRCDKTWLGDAYYGSDFSDVLCDECAREYWHPLPYENYKHSGKGNNNNVIQEESSTKSYAEQVAEFDRLSSELEALADKLESSEEQGKNVVSDSGNSELASMSYEAKGRFSEGLAFVTYRNNGQKYGYIDKTGKVVCTLPEGYTYGEPFSEGYAVIIREETPRYAIMDKTGNIVIDGLGYNVLSRASEGIICAYVKDETYSGTVLRTDFLDYKGNVVASINEVPKRFKSSNERAERYFQFGSVSINGRYYDKNGQVLLDLNQRLDSLDITDYQTEDGVQYVFDGHLKEVFDRKNLMFLSVNFTNPYNMVLVRVDIADSGLGATIKFNEDKPYILFTYPNGKEEKCYIDALSALNEQIIHEEQWIIGLQNGYETVIDKNGNFLFEPVKDDIIYYGEGMYCLKKAKKFIDSSGKEIYAVDYVPDSYTVDEEDLYHEGMRISDRKYIDKSGNQINEVYF